MLTVFFPIPTSNKCCCFTAPMSPPGLVLGHRKPLGLQPHRSSSCPELDFVENLTCFPVQKHNILEMLSPCFAAVSLHRCPCTKINHITQARPEVNGFKDHRDQLQAALLRATTALGKFGLWYIMVLPCLTLLPPWPPKSCSRRWSEGRSHHIACEGLGSCDLPHIPFLSTTSVSLVPADTGSCGLRDFT